MFKGFDFAELCADGVGRGDGLVFDDLDSGVNGDAVQSDVATDPSGAARGDGKGFAFDDGGGRKGEVWNEEQILDAPSCQFIMHEEEVWRLVVPDGVHHGLIRTVRHGTAYQRFLAFKLIPESAIGAGKVAGFGVMA